VSDALERLGRVLRQEGGLLAATVPDAPGPPRHGPVAAGGPRAAGREADYEELVEAIREGYELHYGAPRLVRSEDPDLALLAGDRLYALGLARLAGLGDLAAVRELADVIALSAAAQAGGDAGLAEAVWDAGVIAVGHGTSDEYERAKRLARAGDPGARRALEAAARRPGG
jgi:hypothetical protein